MDTTRETSEESEQGGRRSVRPPPDPDPGADTVAVTQLELLRTQSTTALAVNVLVAAFTAWMLWPLVPHATLYGWLAAVGAVTAGRALLLWACHRRRLRDPCDVGAWRRVFLVGAAVSGLAWGAAGWLFPPHGPLMTQLLVVFVLGGMAAGAIPVLAPLPHAYSLYLAGAMTPVVVWLLRQWDPVHSAMGCLLLIFCTALYMTARNYQRTLQRSFTLGLQNQSLVDHLSEANAALGATNERLEAEVAERERAESALRESEARSRTLLENAPVCIQEMALDGKLLAMNPAGLRMMGVREVAGGSFLDVVGPGERERVARALSRAAEGHACAFEFSAAVDEGERVFACNVIPLTDAHGAVDRLVGVTQDITDAYNLSRLLHYHASHDALTGLVNRREFEARLERVLEAARATGSEHALCYLDLDQFKVINDTCGHVAGDELLRQLGELLGARVRTRDTLARLGGDEFGVLMEHCPLERAREVADGLRHAIEDFRFAWEDKNFSIGVSIGLVPIDAASEGTTAVLSAADAACYAAKDRGRNRIHVYHAGDVEVARRHGEMQWVARIQRALEDERFELDVQPIVPLVSGAEAEVLYELLMRMEGEDGRVIPPGAFLPAAERYRVAARLDRWAVARAVEWLAGHGSGLERAPLCSVNLSADTVGDAGFPDFVMHCVEQRGVPAGKLCFEIAESIAVTRPGEVMRLVSALREPGCLFALDDFGGGPSSFGHVKRLPVEFVKIHGALVRRITEDAVDRTMVRSIHELARASGRRSIAKSVQDEATLARLRAIGVDYAQGYALARPRRLGEPVR